MKKKPLIFPMGICTGLEVEDDGERDAPDFYILRLFLRGPMPEGEEVAELESEFEGLGVALVEHPPVYAQSPTGGYVRGFGPCPTCGLRAYRWDNEKLHCVGCGKRHTRIRRRSPQQEES